MLPGPRRGARRAAACPAAPGRRGRSVRGADAVQAEGAQRLALRPVRSRGAPALPDHQLRGHDCYSAARRGAAARRGSPSRRLRRRVGSRSPLAGRAPRDRLAAQRGDLLGALQRAQPFDRRLHEIDRVLGAEALREHVLDAGQLEHGAHRAAGDHAGSLRGGLQQHLAGAVAADDLMRDRLCVLRHAEQALLAALDGLLDRERDLVGLAVADARRSGPRRRPRPAP